MQFKLEHSGQVITVQNSPMALGGEASLYTIPTIESLVAKIYHKSSQERADKLAAMIANPPLDPDAASVHPSIAWPLERLFTLGENPTCIGYVMPHITDARSIFQYYNPKTRREQCPLFNYRYLIRTARNFSAAMRALHLRGYVIGDVNESNVLVSDTALVTLVDTDSFQVFDGTKFYRCPVGKPEFTPPELQSVRFRDTTRVPEHDAFGLAVLIFLLLMEGTHPYSGRLMDNKEEPLELAERIAAGYFPYSTGRRCPYEPMPLAPPIGLLHTEVRNLMRQCFETGHTNPSIRPGADIWQKTLEVAESRLQVCHANSQHLFRTGIGVCPWCERSRRMGNRDPFPSREAIKASQHLRHMESQHTEPPADANVPTLIQDPRVERVGETS